MYTERRKQHRNTYLITHCTERLTARPQEVWLDSMHFHFDPQRHLLVLEYAGTPWRTWDRLPRLGLEGQLLALSTLPTVLCTPWAGHSFPTCPQASQALGSGGCQAAPLSWLPSWVTLLQAWHGWPLQLESLWPVPLSGLRWTNSTCCPLLQGGLSQLWADRKAVEFLHFSLRKGNTPLSGRHKVLASLI